jgi:hypothetical protein
MKPHVSYSMSKLQGLRNMQMSEGAGCGRAERKAFGISDTISRGS